MKNLGWMNDWAPRVWKDNEGNVVKHSQSTGDTTPEDYRKCRELEHRTLGFANHTRCYTKEFCAICKIYWEIDSSD